MDKHFDKTAQEVASKLGVKKEIINSVLRNVFASLRQELLKMELIRYRLPYFLSFEVNRKTLIENALKFKSEKLLKLAELRDNYRTKKSYYKDELSKTRDQIKDSHSEQDGK